MILSETGMDHGAVFVATCLAAAIGCLVMGLIARLSNCTCAWYGAECLTLPIGLYWAWVYLWQTALGAVFVSGLVFIAISMFKIREAIVNAISNVYSNWQWAVSSLLPGSGCTERISGIIVDNPSNSWWVSVIETTDWYCLT